MESNQSDTVQYLLDRQEILDCVYRYARGMDRWDRELARSAYHDDAIDDHGQFVGGVDEFLDWAFSVHGEAHASHQHAILNHTCDLDSDGKTAHTESYYHFVSLNNHGEPWSMVAGRYIDRFEKRNGRWAIAARVVVRDWMATEERIGRENLTGLVVGKDFDPTESSFTTSARPPMRDRTDPSYDRPLSVEEARLRQSQATR
ncbi:nuclear transport factor 2 family protein [Arthrobacter sp. B0490]|uniref:nuclear transport factor 2 family protein n=1 Tax=Arthrobacter sp. B0490 TaxID=2058891 RepID=UPI000CE3DD8A|nr:nuclear transport factor 2 family protein [Arthrobacter sp. B0490]